MHHGIHVTHGVIAHTHAVFVFALFGIGKHGLGLVHTHDGLARKVVGVDQYRPRLVIVLPVFVRGEDLESGVYLFVDGVVEIVVVEKCHLLHSGIAFFLMVTLSLSLCNPVVNTFDLVVNIIAFETGTIEISVGVD